MQLYKREGRAFKPVDSEEVKDTKKLEPVKKSESDTIERKPIDIQTWIDYAQLAFHVSKYGAGALIIMALALRILFYLFS